MFEPDLDTVSYTGTTLPNLNLKDLPYIVDGMDQEAVETLEFHLYQEETYDAEVG